MLVSVRGSAPGVTKLSTMIAVRPRSDEAQALHPDDPADLHCTLCFLGDYPGDLADLAGYLAQVAAGHAPLEGAVSGVGVFADNGKGHPQILLPSAPGLTELRVAVTQALAAAGVDYSRQFGFHPHMTVGYSETPDPPGTEMVGAPLHFDAICIVRGNEEETLVPLTGVKPLTASLVVVATSDKGEEIGAVAEAHSEGCLPDYGDCYWHAADGKVFWIVADYTSNDEIDAGVAAFEQVDGVLEVEACDECAAPAGGGWERVFGWIAESAQERSGARAGGDSASTALNPPEALLRASRSTFATRWKPAPALRASVPAVTAQYHNRVVEAARARADELEPRLAALLEPIFYAAGDDAARTFTARTTVTAGAAWSPPGGDELIDVPALAATLRTKTDPVRLAAIESTMGATLEPHGLSFDVTNPFTEQVLAQSGSQVTAIAETTRANIMRSVREAYDQGLSIPDTAKLIRAGMRDATPARATLIARTELAGAVNGGSLAATRIVEEEIGVAFNKQWLTAPGAIYPRHELYEGLNGQTTALDGTFDVGGYDLGFPGDPDGPPEEVCNCRCALAYVEAGSVPQSGPSEEASSLPSTAPELTPPWDLVPGGTWLSLDPEGLPIYRTENAHAVYKGKSVWGEGRYFGTDAQEVADLQLDPESPFVESGDLSKVDRYTLPANARILEVHPDAWTNDQLHANVGAALRKKALDGGYDGVHIVTEDANLGGDQIVLYRPLEEIEARAASSETLNSLNPTGGVFAKYGPAARASTPLGPNITTLDKTMNVPPDTLVTIYRGAPTSQGEIVAGDFVTTNRQLAEDYAGNGQVLSKRVPASHILDDSTEPLGEEYIYRPAQADLPAEPVAPPLTPSSDQQLLSLVEQAEARPKAHLTEGTLSTQTARTRKLLRELLAKQATTGLTPKELERLDYHEEKLRQLLREKEIRSGTPQREFAHWTNEHLDREIASQREVLGLAPAGIDPSILAAGRERVRALAKEQHYRVTHPKARIPEAGTLTPARAELPPPSNERVARLRAAAQSFGADTRRAGGLADPLATFDELQAAEQEMTALGAEIRTEIQSRISTTMGISDVTRRKAFSEVMAEIRPMGKIDPSASGFKKITGTVDARADIEKALGFYPQDWVAQAKDQTLRLKATDRGYFREGNERFGEPNEIAVSPRYTSVPSDSPLFSTSLHEVGHLMEFNVPAIRAAESAFYARRTEGDLVRLLPGKKDEFYRMDEWTHPYMGRDYGVTAYEVGEAGPQPYRGSYYELLTMGMEAIVNGRFALDDDMTNFILGLLATV